VGIEVDLRSLKRFKFLDAWPFLVRAEYPDRPPSLEDVQEVSADICWRLAKDDISQVRAEQWVMTPDGWSGMLVNAPATDDAMAFLERFAQTWGSRAEGKIVGGPRERYGPHSMEPALCALVSYTVTGLEDIDSNHRPMPWLVPEKLTRHLTAQAVAWAYQQGADYYLLRILREPWWVHVTDEGIEDAFADAVLHWNWAEIKAGNENPYRAREVKFAPNNEGAYQISDPSLEWAERVEIARRVLTWVPRDTAVGFLRYSTRGGPSWDHEWPYVKESAIRYNRPLLHSFVPDAHGVQLLTSAHLDRAHDMSAWTITELPGDRHLVEAPDLEPWYSTPEPDPVILAAARADFGEMILTYDLLEQHNPWPPDDPSTRSNRAMIRRARQAQQQ